MQFIGTDASIPPFIRDENIPRIHGIPRLTFSLIVDVHVTLFAEYNKRSWNWSKNEVFHVSKVSK